MTENKKISELNSSIEKKIMSTNKKLTLTEMTDENQNGTISLLTRRTAISEVSRGQSNTIPERVYEPHDEMRNRHESCSLYRSNVPQSDLHAGSYSSDVPNYSQSSHSISSFQIRTPSKFNPFEDNHLRPVSESVIRAGHQVIRRGIKFSGKASEDGHEFLMLLADVILQYGIQKNEVLSFIPFTLDKLALSWYSIEVRNFRNYSDFLNNFKRRFILPDYKVWEDIWSRSQGPTETLLEYLTMMEILFSYLEHKPPIDQQIDLIYRNLHPIYLMQIDREEIRNYNDFIKQAHKIERKMWLISRYTPPPPPEETYIPAAAYDGKGKVHSPDSYMLDVMGYFNSLTVSSSEKELEEKSEVDRVIVSSVKKAGRKTSARLQGACFSCGKLGHFVCECPGQESKKTASKKKTVVRVTEKTVANISPHITRSIHVGTQTDY